MDFFNFEELGGQIFEVHLNVMMGLSCELNDSMSNER